MKMWLVSAGMLLLPLSTACADSVNATVDHAYVLCQVFDSTGLTSSPCEVSGWNSTVTAVVDMSAAEARKLCPQVVELMRQKGARFNRGWKLQIRSPYSGENSIAFCNLPN